jgi:hypothetical protein
MKFAYILWGTGFLWLYYTKYYVLYEIDVLHMTDINFNSKGGSTVLKDTNINVSTQYSHSFKGQTIVVSSLDHHLQLYPIWCYSKALSLVHIEDSHLSFIGNCTYHKRVGRRVR